MDYFAAESLQYMFQIL